jgi:hypothetical protein
MLADLADGRPVAALQNLVANELEHGHLPRRERVGKVSHADDLLIGPVGSGVCSWMNRLHR